MKKLITSTLTLVIALSFTACGGDNAPSVSQGKTEMVISPSASQENTETVIPPSASQGKTGTIIPLNNAAEAEPNNPDSPQKFFFDLQQNADNGDEPWRLNPEEVAREFAVQTLNFEGTTATMWNGEKEAARVTVTKESGEAVMIDLYQPAVKGQGGIWDIECWYDENNKCYQIRDLTALPPLFYNDENVPQKIRDAVRNAVVNDWTEAYKVYYKVLGFYATGVSYTAGNDSAEVKFIMAMVTQNEKDPDTIGYIKEAKDSGSEYYQQFYDEYSMPQTGNFELKVTMSLDASGEVLPDTIQVFSNVSPVGEDYVLTKADDFLPKE